MVHIDKGVPGADELADRQLQQAELGLRRRKVRRVDLLLRFYIAGRCA